MWSKPEEGDYLIYDGGYVILRDKDGYIKDMWEATSGVPGSGPEDQGKKDYGPIPEGEYTFSPQEVQHFDWYNPADWYRFKFRGDWGDNRVPLDPTPMTEIEQNRNDINRYGFFFHGGNFPGSAGCIDLGDNEEDFFNTIQQYDHPLELKVIYVP